MRGRGRGGEREGGREGERERGREERERGRAELETDSSRGRLGSAHDVDGEGLPVGFVGLLEVSDELVWVEAEAQARVRVRHAQHLGTLREVDGCRAPAFGMSSDPTPGKWTGRGAILISLKVV